MAHTSGIKANSSPLSPDKTLVLPPRFHHSSSDALAVLGAEPSNDETLPSIKGESSPSMSGAPPLSQPRARPVTRSLTKGVVDREIIEISSNSTDYWGSPPPPADLMMKRVSGLCLEYIWIYTDCVHRPKRHPSASKAASSSKGVTKRYLGKQKAAERRPRPVTLRSTQSSIDVLMEEVRWCRIDLQEVMEMTREIHKTIVSIFE